MRHTEIDINGRTVAMPSITLGTTWFGTKMDKQIALSQMDYYEENGGTWIDTARVYGLEIFAHENHPANYEDSEAVVGQWLKSKRGARDKMIIITKGAHSARATGAKRLNAKEINHDIETSLRTIGIDNVDIYFLHSDDESVPVSEVMPILHELVKSGKTRGLGASNWSVARIAEANAFARENKLTPFSISQVRWSYAIPPATAASDRPDMETDPSQYKGYLELGMPVMAYSSQSKGFFIKTDGDCFDPDAIGRCAEFLSEDNIRRARKIHLLASKEGISVSAMAFAYLWGKQIPVTAMVGCQSLEHLKASLTDCDYIPGSNVIEALEAEKQ